MENKIDFFEKNLKKIVKKELQLKEQDIEINTVKTRIESIPFFNRHLLSNRCNRWIFSNS